MSQLDESNALILRQIALIEQQVQTIARQERMIKGLWKHIYMLQRFILRTRVFERGARETLSAMSHSALHFSHVNEAEHKK